ncbi:hypothetical protein LTR57_018441 [Friedmanniomyces endolithicus]|nr:hypothetical protein LTR57_018441 [Friedmanniomyces endolithicus]
MIPRTSIEHVSPLPVGPVAPIATAGLYKKANPNSRAKLDTLFMLSSMLSSLLADERGVEPTESFGAGSGYDGQK